VDVQHVGSFEQAVDHRVHVPVLEVLFHDESPSGPISLDRELSRTDVLGKPGIFSVPSACLELARTNDLAAAVAARNPDLAPELAFADLGGHGYAVVSASGDLLDVESVCVPDPLVRSPEADGGPLAYRVAHQVKRWNPGGPQVQRTRVEGTLPLVL
jgi:hypothetical protein